MRQWYLLRLAALLAWAAGPARAQNVGIGTTNPGQKLDVAGSVRATGFATASDARLKQQVRPLAGALAAVQRLRGVRYTWNARGVQRGGPAGAEQVGLLAQEVEQVYPEWVSTGPDGYEAVNYAQLALVLLEALKKLKGQLAAATQRAAAEARQQADHASPETLQSELARLRDAGLPAAQARR